MTYDWNRHGGDFVKWENPGDTIEGEILSISEGSDFNGQPVPLLVFATADGEMKWTVGQRHALVKLSEIRPETGWTLKAVYARDGEGKPGRAPAKLFDITVTSKTPTAGVSSADDL